MKASEAEPVIASDSARAPRSVSASTVRSPAGSVGGALQRIGETLNTAHLARTAKELRFLQRGLASWYGRNFHGRRTASGERFDMYAMTAAHPTLPLSSLVRVRNVRNDREVIVRVNDRGPFHRGRIIDLSYTAARALGLHDGVASVEIERISEHDLRHRQAQQAAPAAGLPTRDSDAGPALVRSDVPEAVGPAAGRTEGDPLPAPGDDAPQRLAMLWHKR